MLSRFFILITLVCAAISITACERRETTPEPVDSGSAPMDADNTGRNERDAGTGAKTPVDQSENSEDIRITADIRRAILDDDTMSMNAENVKIMTANGVVTLRGPVETQAEKDAIAAKAAAVSGVTRVDNQLEVKSN